MPKVAAIILAAGESSRFGKPKQLLEIHGKSLVRRIVDEAVAANCSPIIVVTGAANTAISREINSSGATLVRNGNWRRGIGTSIGAGVQHLIDNVSDIDAVVLLVSDQLFVDGKTIQDL